MKHTGQAIAAGLCVLLLCGCSVSPVINSEPEQEKIQIIGQIDGRTDAAMAYLVTPAQGSEEGSDSEKAAASETEPTPTPAPTEAPTPEPTEAPTETPAPTDTPEPTGTPEPDRTKAQQLCDTARAFTDVPYVKGGKTEEGFDPGGFTFYCLNKIGVKIGHKTSKGYSEMEDWQRVDSMDDLEPGDLCFFITGENEAVNCVCIYLGNGEMIYPSSSSGKVIITSISTNYWIEAFVFARRVF